MSLTKSKSKKEFADYPGIQSMGLHKPAKPLNPITSYIVYLSENWRAKLK